MIWLAAVGAGAGGAVARYVIATAVQRRAGADVPAGTAIVNITGACLLGFAGGLGLGDDAFLVLGAGLAGGFTTYSTWMVETVLLFDDGTIGIERGLFNLFGMAAAGLGAAAAGACVAGWF